MSTPLPRRALGLALGAALLAALVLALLPGRALATDDDYVRVSAGETTLRLDPKVVEAVTGAGVAVAPVDPAAVTEQGIAFPITSGTIGEDFSVIDHEGGLRFSAGDTSLELTDFRIVVAEDDGLLYATAGERVLPILKLDLDDAKVSADDGVVRIDNVAVKLTRLAARVLNRTFDTNLFRGGLKLGHADVRAVAADVKVKGGATTLALSEGAAAALTSLGVAAAPIAPATAGDAGLAFPITGGAVDAQTLFGRITHSGGIRLSKGSTVVELRDFTIDLDESPSLSAKVGHQRVDILDLDLSGLTQSVEGNVVTLGGIDATLTAAAAGALNGAFGVTAFTEGLLLGTATVRAEV